MECCRLDQFLFQQGVLSTRSQASKMIAGGHVTISGKRLKPAYIPRLGDVIEIKIPLEPVDRLVPFEYPLEVIFEDDDLLVVNKPSGLVVHPAVGHRGDTLVNALVHRTTRLSQGYSSDRPGIVHRLDRDTSGLLVVARNDYAHSQLGRQFMRRSVHRIYWAIVYGTLKKSEGCIESFIARHPQDRKRFFSLKEDEARGKRAVTHYRVIATCSSGLSLVHLKLETGRTHQIRVHLSDIGHPIVGDLTYGNTSRISQIKSVSLRKIISQLDRFALHASELGFSHPRSERWIQFKVDWPKNLMELVEYCEFQNFSQKEVHWDLFENPQ